MDWERNRLTVPSPKTRSHGKPHRVIPLFTLLRPHLEAAFDHAEEGSEFIIPKEYRERAEGEREWGGANLRTQFGKIVRRAGVDPWPRLWHSLRASCESDLAQSFPLATVTKWLGNTPSVALRHYVDPTEMAFDRAVNWMPESGARTAHERRTNGARTAHERRSRGTWGSAPKRTPTTKTLRMTTVQRLRATCCQSLRNTVQKLRESVSESNRLGALFTPPTGFEDLKAISASTDTASASATDAERLASCLAFLSRMSPDLALFIKRWERLPEPVRAGIMAMVCASL